MKLKTGIILNIIIVALFGGLVYLALTRSPEKQSFGGTTLFVNNGGTGASSFSPSSLIVSGPTATSSQSASSSPQVGIINATSTNATSTFAGGISSAGLKTSSGLAITGGDILLSSSATSTFNNGIIFTGGCVVVNGACVGGGGGAVSSVSNSDGTLTISPTTGAVVASLNPATAFANTAAASSTFIGGLLTGKGFSGLFATLQNIFLGSGAATNTVITGNGTSTFGGGGINVTSGCVAVGGNCLPIDYSVRVSKTGNQALNANPTTIAWDTENFDTDTMHDNVTNNTRITFNHGGKYHVGCEVEYSTNSVFGVEIEATGTNIISRTQGGNSNANNAFETNTIFYFSPNDYIECIAQPNTTGGNATVNSNFWANKLY